MHVPTCIKRACILRKDLLLLSFLAYSIAYILLKGFTYNNNYLPRCSCCYITAKPPTSLLIRTCVVDNGETNFETEIGRVSYCGIATYMIYNGTRWQGCLLVCNTDGCNKGLHAVERMTSLKMSLLIMFSLTYYGFCS